MRLSELNPKLDGPLDSGILSFDCPLGHPHRLIIPVGAYGTRTGWAATGEFPDTLTLTPSIMAHHGSPHGADFPDVAEYERASVCGWHGFIRAGEMVAA